jgi:uncharacterized protein (DUF952 family)
MLVFKIFRKSEWQALQTNGETKGAAIDLVDGFVHLSTGSQVAETLERHFANETDLVLAALEVESLEPELKWEPSRGEALFPHLYRNLRANEVTWSQSLELSQGRHILPDKMA